MCEVGPDLIAVKIGLVVMQVAEEATSSGKVEIEGITRSRIFAEHLDEVREESVEKAITILGGTEFGSDLCVTGNKLQIFGQTLDLYRVMSLEDAKRCAADEEE
ncbi:hypothetical protein BWQ96_01973 [Gracilariopsis chorda]|uniref:Uncharacterized protein n=1 Tax=Gracilariopsis chorda TaxID=448386 RepID=A0A2V3J1M4_9FLOR|nr:hypothetical protein BWQ96_01973 [Gracilariopsis chorda]|eukprot:PXF48284.1 hypothetical protein BWQ96_01973 [Gracilariopsis chorda]